MDEDESGVKRAHTRIYRLYLVSYNNVLKMGRDN